MLHDKEIRDAFLAGSPATIQALFDTFLAQYRTLAPVSLYPTRSMTGIDLGGRRVAWVLRPGKTFLDIVFPFDRAYPDNLCFLKIAQVPGSGQYNHHLRLRAVPDLNEEVLQFMKLSL